MGYEIPIVIAYTTLFVILGAAWVGGYLDQYQRTAQDFALGKMGDNRASFGVKSELLLFNPRLVTATLGGPSPKRPPFCFIFLWRFWPY